MNQLTCPQCGADLDECICFECIIAENKNEIAGAE